MHRDMMTGKKLADNTQHDHLIRQRAAALQRVQGLNGRGRVSCPLFAITQVTLAKRTPETLGRFQEQVRRMPEVWQCLYLSGDCDFMLQTVVPDTHAYYEFLTNKLCPLRYVAHVGTSFVLKEYKGNR